MAERMPNIGESAWHNILGANDGSGGFLRVTLNDDGTLRPTLGQTITPSALTANTDNWNPTGLDTATVVRVSMDTTHNLTGIQSPSTNASGRTLILTNVSETVPITLIHESVNSTTSNRLYFGGTSVVGTFTLSVKSSAVFVYDTTSNRWRCVSLSQANNYITNPVAPGTASPGTSPLSSPSDHVHPATDIAVDTIWNAAGDIAYATGADAATVLAVGSAFRTLRANSGATAPEWAGGMTLIGDSGALAASAANIDFSSISGSYTHMLVVGNVRSTRAAAVDTLWVRANNDSGSNYDRHGISGTGLVVTAFSSSAGAQWDVTTMPGSSADANKFAPQMFLFPDYSNSSRNKMMLALGATIDTTTTTNWEIDIGVGLWRNTAAINRLTFLPTTGGLAIGSRITVYGMSI